MATITAPLEVTSDDGLTLDELAQFCLQAIAAGATGAEAVTGITHWRTGRLTKLRAVIATARDFPSSGTFGQVGSELDADLRRLTGPHHPIQGDAD